MGNSAVENLFIIIIIIIIIIRAGHIELGANGPGQGYWNIELDAYGPGDT